MRPAGPRWSRCLALSLALHVAALGALAWAAGSWVRVAPPNDAVFVTLLAEPAATHASMVSSGRPAQRPPAASDAAVRAPAAPPPARERPAAAPPHAPAREPSRETRPRRVERAAAAQRETQRAEPREPGPAGSVAWRRAAHPPDGAIPPDDAIDPDPAHAAARPSSPGDGDAPAAVPPAHAARAPGPGIDADRVYGEGEVDRVAAPIGGIRRPEYPARERLLGREGRVSLLVEVGADGAVRDVRVARSAGEAFDASARRAVERTAFRAARRGDRAVASTVTVNVAFELD